MLAELQFMVEGTGFEPVYPKDRIYSPAHLTALPPLHKKIETTAPMQAAPKGERARQVKATFIQNLIL